MKEVKGKIMAEGTQTEQNIGITTAEAWKHAAQHGTVVEKGNLLERMRAEGQLGTDSGTLGVKLDIKPAETIDANDEIKTESRTPPAHIPAAPTITEAPAPASSTIKAQAAESPKIEEPAKIEEPTSEKTKKNKKEKPNALVKDARGLNLLYKTKVVGGENLETIPQGKNIIIVTTHNNDSDVGLVINALGSHFKNITVVEESTHYIFKQDPISFLGRLMHRKNAFRVDYNNGSDDRKGKFDPNNFEPMKKSLEEGKPLVMAAYFTPNYSETVNGLPDKTGNGTAYLAQITKDAIILPVAVDIKLDKPVLKKSDNNNLYIQRLLKGRISADVTIGQPFTLDHIENIDHLGEIIQKRKTGAEPATKEELEEFSRLNKGLKEQSKAIMQHLAELLPPEKRGVWGNK